jgi:hypothetical protein
MHGFSGFRKKFVSENFHLDPAKPAKAKATSAQADSTAADGR